ncbi:MAG: hypothetical protein ACRD7E_16925 [Bryobacteraceae bacterium]
MLVRFSKILSAAAVTSSLCANMWAQAGQTPQGGQTPAGQQQGAQAGEAKPASGGKNWKDRAEFDLFEQIRTEKSPQKKLELLNTYKTKYPETDFKQERLLLYLNTYQALNQFDKVYATAKEILASDPKDVTALYYITLLTPQLNNQDPAALDTAEKAANGLLSNLDTIFSAEKKPATTSEPQWKKERSNMEALGHKTLGWVAMIRKNNDVAHQELQKSLELNPNDGFVSYWLGQVMVAQIGEKNTPEQTPIALYHFARASTYEGPGAVTPEGRKQIEDYLRKTYTGYHGDDSGLAEIKTQAKQSALPPAGFTVKSVKELAVEKLAKEEEFKRQNPKLALWMNLKDALQAETGEQYFETGMKGTALPALKGKLVSQDPPTRPKELKLAMSDEMTPELTIVLDAPLAGKADPGTELEFEGAVAKTFTKDPFMVTVELEKSKLVGWPEQAAPAKRRRSAR